MFFLQITNSPIGKLATKRDTMFVPNIHPKSISSFAHLTLQKVLKTTIFKTIVPGSSLITKVEGT